MQRTKYLLTAALGILLLTTSCDKDKDKLKKNDTDPITSNKTCSLTKVSAFEDGVHYLDLSFQFDGQNRLERAYEIEGTDTVSYTQYIRNGAGQIIKSEYHEPNHTLNGYVTHNYNAQGQLTESIWYYYNNTTLVPDDKQQYEYNSDGRISKILMYWDKDGSWEHDEYLTITYDAAGNPATIRFYEAKNNRQVGLVNNSFDAQKNPWRDLSMPDLMRDPIELLMFMPANTINKITYLDMTNPFNSAEIKYTNVYDSKGKLSSQTRHDPFDGDIKMDFSYSNCP